MGRMEPRNEHCPNCSAPVKLAVGQIEALCGYCGSHLRFTPDKSEMEVLKTREEMRYRERVAVKKAVLRQQLEREEMAAWRKTAANVAIAALPVVGNVASRSIVNAAIRKGGGCFGCGCLGLLVAGAVVVGAVHSLLG